VGAAMELRGYCDGHLQSFHATTFGLADLGTFGAAAVALGSAIAVRVLGAP